jgi:PEGA domain
VLLALGGVVSVGASGVGVAAPAAASDPKTAARKKLVEGADLLKRADYPAALARFQAAYELVPSPKIQYNFGLAYMGLGRNADALKAFHTFLSEASDASTDTITKARIYKEGLLQKICRVTVRADVDGASIGIDGRSYGQTPHPDEILVDAGAHALTVEKSGFPRRFTKSFDATPGGSFFAEARLLTPDPHAEAAAAAMTTSTAAPMAGILAAPAPEPTAAHARWAKWTGLTTGALAVVALGFGTVEWVIKEQKAIKFNERASACNPKVAGMGGPICNGLATDSNHAKSLGYAGFAAAAVLGVASTVFLLVDHRTHASASSESALLCAPSLTVPGGVCRLVF